MDKNTKRRILRKLENFESKLSQFEGVPECHWEIEKARTQLLDEIFNAVEGGQK